MTVKISDRIIKRIWKLAAEGLGQADIAEILEVTQPTVQKYDPRKVGRGKKKHLRSYNG